MLTETWTGQASLHHVTSIPQSIMHDTPHYAANRARHAERRMHIARMHGRGQYAVPGLEQAASPLLCSCCMYKRTVRPANWAGNTYARNTAVGYWSVRAVKFRQPDVGRQLRCQLAVLPLLPANALPTELAPGCVATAYHISIAAMHRLHL